MTYKIVTNTDSPDVKRLMQQITRHGEDSCPMELIYKNNRNRTYRVLVDGRWAVLKCFKVPNWLNSYVYSTVRKSKARRSYEYAKRLVELGVSTPMPLAYAECHNGLRLGHSYYLCEYVDAHDVREWQNWPCDATPMLKALARDMVELHRKGVFHKDFSPGNVLFTKESNGEYKFYYIDLNRMRFDVHDARVLMQNFRCINLDKKETLCLARYYAEAAGLDPAATEREAGKQLDRYLAEKERHNRIKQMLRGK